MTDPISLDPLLFRELQVALLQQQLVRHEIQALGQRAKDTDQAVLMVIAKAGLDPAQKYQLNQDDYSITPV